MVPLSHSSHSHRLLAALGPAPAPFQFPIRPGAQQGDVGIAQVGASRRRTGATLQALSGWCGQRFVCLADHHRGSRGHRRRNPVGAPPGFI